MDEIFELFSLVLAYRCWVIYPVSTCIQLFLQGQNNQLSLLNKATSKNFQEKISPIETRYALIKSYGGRHVPLFTEKK